MVIYQNIFIIKFSARFLHKPSSVNWFKALCIKGFCTNMIQTCDATKSIYCFFLLTVGNAWICLLAVLNLLHVSTSSNGSGRSRKHATNRSRGHFSKTESKEDTRAPIHFSN